MIVSDLAGSLCYLLNRKLLSPLVSQVSLCIDPSLYVSEFELINNLPTHCDALIESFSSNRISTCSVSVFDSQITCLSSVKNLNSVLSDLGSILFGSDLIDLGSRDLVVDISKLNWLILDLNTNL